jgi:enoyl-CoA hydratase
LGGGLELALCCDFRVCATTAKLGQPEILLGVIPGAGGTQRLPRLIGTGRAKDLVYSGRTLGTDEALGIGLVTTVVPDEELYRRAVGLARRYAAGPSVALAAAKRVIGEGMEAPLEEGLEAERRAFASLFSTEDQAIGMASFAEKGPGKADFVGR